MSESIIQIENISKEYQLGVIGNDTLYKDLQSWWYKIRGKEDPNSKIDSKNIRLHGEKFWALKDISFDVTPGERVGIIGKNGAGKSTLLKIMSRITTPTAGKIKIKGRVASLLEVGTGFHPELTGKENIFLNGAILGMTKEEVNKKIDEIIEFSGVEEYIDTPVKRYSSGMYVRLAFSVAAHLDPEILIVDEVLAVGDASFQQKCLGKMRDVSGAGRTIIFVSHNMDALRRLCTRGIYLNEGTIEIDSNIEEATEQYLKFEDTQKVEKAYYSNSEISKYVKKSDHFEIFEIRILDHKNQEKSLFEYGEKVYLELTWICKKSGQTAHPGFNLTNSARSLVISAVVHPGMTTSSEDTYSKEISPGTYITKIELPTEQLSGGKYSIDPTINEIIGKYSGSYLHDKIFFTIQPPSEFFNYFKKAPPGVIYKILDQKTKKIS
jgi:lipopolysaccharide transport system ATP-binding protein